MNTPKPSFTLPVTIYTADTDFTGIVYHANYLKYFEHSRSSWLDQLDAPLEQLMEQGVIFAIKNATIDYIKPLRLGQTILSTAAVSRGKACSLLFHQTLIDTENTDIIYCKADILVACLDTNMKPQRLPPTLRELAQ
jgi:acyl-CoA thioester hydrolase